MIKVGLTLWFGILVPTVTEDRVALGLIVTICLILTGLASCPASH